MEKKGDLILQLSDLKQRLTAFDLLELHFCYLVKITNWKKQNLKEKLIRIKVIQKNE